MGGMPNSMLQGGSVAEVRQWTKRVCEVAGKGGGFIMSTGWASTRVQSKRWSGVGGAGRNTEVLGDGPLMVSLNAAKPLVNACAIWSSEGCDVAEPALTNGGRYQAWFGTPGGAGAPGQAPWWLTSLSATGLRRCRMRHRDLTRFHRRRKVVGLDIPAPCLAVPRQDYASYYRSADASAFVTMPSTRRCQSRLEFVEDTAVALAGLPDRKPGGFVLVATLNSLSPWAERPTQRRAAGRRILECVLPVSTDLCACSSHPGVIHAAVHFQKG
jgi:hypothetical protein